MMWGFSIKSTIRMLMLPALLITGACAGPSAQMSLMATPAVFQSGQIDPFRATPRALKTTEPTLFYASDRNRIVVNGRTVAYAESRGDTSLLGIATVSIADGESNWEELRAKSLLAARKTEPALQVSELFEFGSLLTEWDVTEINGPVASAVLPSLRYLAAINYRLDRSAKKDVYIYVSDAQTGFNSAVMRSAQIWHYLGYDGAFVTFAWSLLPGNSGPRPDLAALTASSRNLRQLLQLLTTGSSARAIHILGHGNGNLIVFQALKDLRLIHYTAQKPEGTALAKIEQAILIGTSIDWQMFNLFNRDRIFETVGRISLYVPADNRSSDSPGQSDNAKGDRQANRNLLFLYESGRISLIEMPPAKLTRGRGPSSFLGDDPWLSSDVLMSLKFTLKPGERGLVRDSFTSAWHFPVDYITRLQQAVSQYYRK